MTEQEIKEYIVDQQAQGVANDAIRQALLDQGHSQEEVEEAFDSLSQPSQETSKKHGEDAAANTASSQMPSALQLLDTTVDYYKHRFRQILAIMALPALISFLPSIFINLVKDDNKLLSFFILSLSKFGLLVQVVLWIGIIIFLLAVLILPALGQIALIYSLINNQEHIDTRELYAKGLKMLIPFWTVQFLAGFLIFGGMMLLIVPGIVMSVWFSLAIYVLMVENVRGTDAVLKSREYVRGVWWSVCGKLLVIGLVSLVISLLGGIILFPLSLLKVPLLDSLGSILNYVVLVPLGTVYSYLLYTNLVKVKGSVAYQNSKKRKAKYLGVGFAGIIMYVLLIIALVMILSGVYHTLTTTPSEPHMTLPTLVSPIPSNVNTSTY